jgi:hypothetical protein
MPPMWKFLLEELENAKKEVSFAFPRFTPLVACIVYPGC